MQETISIEGILLMLDDLSPHAGIPVQAICDGKVMATVLSDERGRYQFTNLKQERYQVRSHILGGYVYYGEGGSTVTDEARSVFLQVKDGVTRDNINFRFAPFKKGIWRHYTCLDGLPYIEVRAICCDPDGVMWFGTRGGGVSSYDGREFANFTVKDGLANNFVHVIYCDPEGVMWFGTENGVSRYDGRGMGDCPHFVNFTTEDGLAGNRILDICGDLEGMIWFAAEGGVSRYDGKEFARLTTENGLVQNGVRAVHCDPDGVMWFGTHGGVSRYDGKNFVNLTVSDGLVGQLVYSICHDPEGIIWFGIHGGISRYDGRQFVNFTEEDGLLNNAGRSICCDPDGVIWFGTLEGVSRYDGETFVNFTSHLNGLELYFDPDGTLWCGHYMGVARYDKDTFVNFSKKDGLPGDIVRAIHRDSDGTLWIGTFGGFSHYDGKQFVNFTMEGSSVGNAVNTVLCDTGGALWIGTNWGGVSRYDGERFVDYTNSERGGPLPHPMVTSIYCDPGGILWFGTGGFIGNGGLARYDGKDFVTFTTQDGLPSDQVLAICGEADGTIWIGTTRGLSRYDARGMGDFPHFVNLTIQDGLIGDSVSAIYCDPDGIMWFGTGEGVSSYDGAEFTNFTNHDGLVHGVIVAIHRTSDGVLWFASHGGGVFMYDGIAWSSLDTRDGLAGNLVRAIDEDPDGSVWLATDGGLVRYRRNPSKPKTRIVSVTADRTYTDLSIIPGIAVGQRITIEYGALDFKTIPEKQQYRFRIREVDKDWRKPTKARLFDYTFDKPGNYTFEAQAIDRDLNYSEPVTLNLNVQPDPMLIELDYLRREVGEKYHFDSIIGRSAAIRQVRALMERAIDSGLTVLIIGETGTGKELVAKAIHYNSQRKGKPLLDRNCGTIPRDLLASDLFGHRKGAFTGATEDKMGLFEAASGGTLLLDEIGEMPQDTQIHLLRVLEERRIQRLGEHTSRNVDVRIIAMTNRDLVKEVGEGHFREDLYYRLSEFPIRIPPLRERVEDIPLLVEHFLKEIDRDLDGFAPGVFDMLQSYSWPGNVRELRNVIRRAAALAEEGEKIQAYHVPPEITHGESLIQEILSERTGLSAAVEALQRRLIQDALQQCNGNRSQAAKILNIHRPSLIRLMRRFGIE